MTTVHQSRNSIEAPQASTLYRREMDIFPLYIFLIMPLFVYGSLFLWLSEDIYNQSFKFYICLSIVFFVLMSIKRVYGVGTLLISLLIIPSGGAFQKLSNILPNYSIAYYDAWIVLLFIVWILGRILQGRIFAPIFFLNNFKWFLLLLGIMIVNGVLRGNPISDILWDLKELAYFIVLCIVIPDFVRSPNDIKLLVKVALIGVCAGIALFYLWYLSMMIYPSSFLNQLMEKYESAGHRIEYRLTFMLFSANFLFFYSVVAIILSKKNVIRWVMGLIFSSGVIVLNQTRTYYLFMPLVTGYLLYRSVKLHFVSAKYVVKAWIVLGLILLVVVLTISLNAPLMMALEARSGTLSSSDDVLGNITARLTPFFLTVSHFDTKSFVVGEGMGTLIEIPWFEKTDFANKQRYVDNLWATMIIKGGVIGVFSIIAFYRSWFTILSDSIKRKHNQQPIFLVLWCMLVLLFLITLTNAVFYNHLTMIMLGIFSGLLFPDFYEKEIIQSTKV